MDMKRFRRLPLLGIVRGIEMDVIEPLVETAVSSGLQSIEITMNTEGAPKLIRKMVSTKISCISQICPLNGRQQREEICLHLHKMLAGGIMISP